MTFQKLQFRPGVVREVTSLTNEGGWYDGDKIRFRAGMPQKIGGWTVTAYNTFLGVCRSLWNWVTLKGFNIVGIGTNLKFYLENGGAYYDITPIRAQTTNTITFSAVTSAPYSSTITVTDSGISNLRQGDFVTFTQAVGLGGNITAAVLNQEYQIQTLIDSNTYTITARAAVTGNIASNNGGAVVTSNASDVGNGGGATDGTYQINTAASFNTVGTGWGVSPWGGFINGSPATTLSSTINSSVTTIPVVSTAAFENTGAIWIENEYITYAAKSTSPQEFTGALRGAGETTRYQTSHSSGTLVYKADDFTGWGEAFASTVAPQAQLRLWSQTNYGQDLLFSPHEGPIYHWSPGILSAPSFTTRGTLVSGVDVPSQVIQLMVSDATRITLAFGCNGYGAYNTTELDPMLIRWSDQENYNDWTDTETNQAGSYRLSRGSSIIGALQSRLEILVWTDSAMYSMQYLGFPLVWGFNLLSDNISIASQNAVVTTAGATFWMGIDKFYVYDGRVNTLPCAVRTYVFDDINRQQFSQVFAGTNEGYTEVWWFYCSKNSNTIDRYVIYNYAENIWYYGTMDRTAWLDTSLRSFPIATTSTGYLVNHEDGVDDGTTNPPSPISSFIQSSDFDIGDGHNYSFVSQIIPDITFNGSDTAGLTSENPYVKFIVRPRQNPGSGYGSAPEMDVNSTLSYAGTQSHNVQQFDQIVYTRVRGRQMAFRIESNTRGTQWQLGVPKMDIRTDGRR